MPAVDPFPNVQAPFWPPTRLALVTPSDTVDLPFVASCFIAGTGGTLKVTTLGGDTVTLPAGIITDGYGIYIRVTRIWATGTAASNIIVMW